MSKNLKEHLEEESHDHDFEMVDDRDFDTMFTQWNLTIEEKE